MVNSVWSFFDKKYLVVIMFHYESTFTSHFEFYTSSRLSYMSLENSQYLSDNFNFCFGRETLNFLKVAIEIYTMNVLYLYALAIHQCGMWQVHLNSGTQAQLKRCLAKRLFMKAISRNTTKSSFRKLMLFPQAILILCCEIGQSHTLGYHYLIFTSRAKKRVIN